MAQGNGKVAFIWQIANQLRGAYKGHDYGKVILPFVVLRRLDCALEDTKDAVLTRAAFLPADLENRDPVLNKAAGYKFHNASKFTFEKLLGDEANVATNLQAYVQGFSANVVDIVEKFDLDQTIAKLQERNLLYGIVSKFADLDLHPDEVSSSDMGDIYEELIRKFAEQSNETAGEHFTPRDAIELMVQLLFATDGDHLARPGTIVDMYDPACGTGGMLALADEHLHRMNSSARLVPHGQEWNDESYAICKSDMLIKGHDASNIAFGNTFTEDAFPAKRFDYVIANPPYGLEWDGYAKAIRKEHNELGFHGRFGPGLPTVKDGQLLFVLHMISKMKPCDAAAGRGGSRVAVVLNGSPLFSGQAGGGESEIRRWIIENDLLERPSSDSALSTSDTHGHCAAARRRRPSKFGCRPPRDACGQLTHLAHAFAPDARVDAPSGASGARWFATCRTLVRHMPHVKAVLAATGIFRPRCGDRRGRCRWR